MGCITVVHKLLAIKLSCLAQKETGAWVTSVSSFIPCTSACPLVVCVRDEWLPVIDALWKSLGVMET